MVNLLRLRWVGWVGDLLPRWLARRLERIDHREVSVGVYRRPNPDRPDRSFGNHG